MICQRAGSTQCALELFAPRPCDTPTCLKVFFMTNSIASPRVSPNLEVKTSTSEATGANAQPSQSLSAQISVLAIRLTGQLILPTACFLAGIGASKLLSKGYKSPALQDLYHPLVKTGLKASFVALGAILAKSCWQRSNVAIEQNHSLWQFLTNDLFTAFEWQIPGTSTVSAVEPEEEEPAEEALIEALIAPTTHAEKDDLTPTNSP